MSDYSDTNSGINIRRVTIFAYVQLLLGMLLLANNLKTWLTDGSFSWAWVVLNILVIVSVIAFYLSPDIVRDGNEAASNYLLVAALVASVVTLLGISSLFL